MHVALNGWFWNSPNTGSGQYTRYLTYHLNRLVTDLKITLVVPQGDGFKAPEAVPPSVDVHLVDTRPGHVGKVDFEQRGFAKACVEVSADIAHVPYWGSPLKSSVPVVVTIHDLTTMLVREYRKGIKARAYNALVAAAARGANHIITDSFSSKLDVIDHLNIPEDDITAIYLAVDETRYTPETDFLMDMAIKQQYDLPDFYILYLGGYEIHKNVMTLLLAFSYVSDALGEDYPLLLAGKKPTKVTERFPDYEAYIEKLGIGNNIRWLGYVDEDHKPVLYREAMTFVFPSRAEGFGLPPLEAMACGTPVVTTDATSLPEIVGDAAFTIDPDKARGMAGSIIATITQDNLAREMREAGLQQADTFSWQSTAIETLQVYDQVLKEI